MASPASAAAPGFTLEARRRISLFLLVLLLSGGAAWGVGRALDTIMIPIDAQTAHDMQHAPGKNH